MVLTLCYLLTLKCLPKNIDPFNNYGILDIDRTCFKYCGMKFILICVIRQL